MVVETMQSASASGRVPKRRRTDGQAADAKDGDSGGKAEPSGRGNRYHCDYCSKDLTVEYRIKCAECKDFDLCVQCFVNGAEIAPHKKTHDYQVMKALNFPLLSPDWNADDELLLLEGIEMYGLGNWSEVAEHVGTKHKHECESHFYRLYINNTPTDVQGGAVEGSGTGVSGTADGASAGGDQPRPSSPHPADGSSSQGARPSPASQQHSQPKGAVLHNTDAAGWMPKRGEFETEWDNAAEEIIADMAFNETDTPAETELKLRVLHIYNAKLDERARRKQFIIERGLLDVKKHQDRDRRRPKEERDMYARMRVFARFQSHEDHETLVRGLVEEQRLRAQIELYKSYREKGLRFLSEVAAYEADKKRRDTDKSLKKARASASYLYNRQAPAAAPVAGRNKRNKRDGAGGPRDAERGPDGKKLGPDKRRLGGANRLDVTGMPRAELLSVKEKQLCSVLGVTPEQYLLIKGEVLTSAAAQLQRAPPVTAAIQRACIDVNKTTKVFEFFVQSGWIPAVPTAQNSLQAAS